MCRYHSMLSLTVVTMLAVMCSARQLYTDQDLRLEEDPGQPECSVANDCGPHSCCLVGYERYSFPRCAPRGDLGAWCRFRNSPRTMTLGYPNNLVIEVQGAHHGMCPCRPGLVCSRRTSKCELPELPEVSSAENSLQGILD